MRWLLDHGLVLVLVPLVLALSLLTWREQPATGESAALDLAERLGADRSASGAVLIAAGKHVEDERFAARLQRELDLRGIPVIAVVNEPAAARRTLLQIVGESRSLRAIACTPTAATDWLVLTDRRRDFPTLADVPLLVPHSYSWPDFLKRSNLVNIAQQIAVIAILSIGMTLVVISGGIDLSVGSLVALAAVLACLPVQEWFGGRDASDPTLILCCLGAVLVCGLVGLSNGLLVAFCDVPPFIVTLAMLLVGAGLAGILTQGETVYLLPDSFVRLGRGADLGGIPNAVVLMLLLYAAAHVLMTRMVLGRWLYAVGGNREAARLSGVPVRRVLLFAYAASGLLAGLGGIVLASQLKSAAASYGQTYELTVVAAVVVGGTSLAGGEGTMIGTLLGAFVIAVLQNGMNLLNVDTYTQRVVLGLVLLIAVLVDRFKKRFG